MYIDDIIIFSTSVENLLAILKKCLEGCVKQMSYWMNLRKLCFTSFWPSSLAIIPFLYVLITMQQHLYTSWESEDLLGANKPQKKKNVAHRFSPTSPEIAYGCLNQFQRNTTARVKFFFAKY